MAQAISQPRFPIAAVGSFACLALQAVWVGLCYIFVDNADPVNWLAGVAGLFAAAVGVCFLSAIGTALGIAGRGTVGGIIALVLNAGLFLVTGVGLLMVVGPLR